METNQRNSTPYPNLPPILESDDREYRDAGITSTLSVAGHPIHPIIVIFPVAFLVGAAGSDIGYWLTSDPFWARASVWLMGVGFAAGILAAITGFLDFFKVKRVRDRSAGWLHMGGNVAVMVLTLINLVLRQGNPAEPIVYTGLAISIVVATLLGVTGWFGGELSFRHKIGVIGPSSHNS
ncbi:Protein of unknown function DUF2231, transmembrane [Oscillatoria nigro-viridis PCC 7112]|uniref:DUF2231 domain-containing protein n=1 Tax=Phormidium nigroviride PCC 7112 TaxID=179408 RepID=K9VEI2_9CYAN|nr:DUF2231 domain-containing protein [Oscillatoria nigro-viridis]AFZ05645.1 Protein of unknown function DUF2231, transmembrane [Oscillatoria nigro-viridis PCC 7112]